MHGGQVQGSDSDARVIELRAGSSSQPDLITPLTPSFERHLRARNLSERTVGDYVKDTKAFAAWLIANDHPADPQLVQQAHIEAYQVAELGRVSERTGKLISPSSVASHYRRLQQFFKWLLNEGEITADPMADMEAPKVPVVPPRIIPDEDVAALLKVMAGASFEERRDTAITRTFLDTGVRLESMAGIQLAHIDWQADTIRVHAKGDVYLDAPFGAKTGEALDRYVRTRSRHRLAGLPWLWLGLKGRLTPSGIYQMTVKRAQAAGIKHVHPHLWRSKGAHDNLAAGMSESDLMELYGWSSSDMPRRYAKANAAQRARAAHRRISNADRF